MGLFLNTRGRSSLAIAICDRCKMKVAYADLRPDGDNPGLFVCSNSCSDQLDPYKLPARISESITLQYPRPDESLDVRREFAVTAEDQITLGDAAEAASPSGPNWPIVFDDFNRGAVLLSASPTPDIGPNWALTIADIQLEAAGYSLRQNTAGGSAQAEISIGALAPSTGVALEIGVRTLSLGGTLGAQTTAPVGMSLLLYGLAGYSLELSAISVLSPATPVPASWSVGCFSVDGSLELGVLSDIGNLPFTVRVEMDTDGQARLYLNGVQQLSGNLNPTGFVPDTYALTLTFLNGADEVVTESLNYIRMEPI